MIRGDIRSLAAYHVPDSTGMVKLDAMENPYGLPAALRSAWAKSLAGTDINRYPDADMRALRQRIGELDGLSAEHVLLGNGSDDIIQMLLIAAEPGPCVVPEPTFVMYNLISRWLKRPVASVPLDKNFGLNAESFLNVCSREKSAITFLACPNNPTGNLWPQETVEKIALNIRDLVVIDEAYRPFAERTHTGLIRENVLVLRTFSKLGWAGLRLGYALGDPELIAQLNKVRLPYNINSLTQHSASFLLDHIDVFEQQAAKIREERDRLFKAMSDLDKVQVFPSQTNFLLFRVGKGHDAGQVFEALRQRGILIKNMHGQNGLLAQCLRVTIGSSEENGRFLGALKEILA
jgi:histidinol-phosphate aminotransferase